ncbi:MAG: chorismate-binding protein [Bacteroidaceae bacterium]|nr:chorismate-binding protein [Bacteroidaceae bacterium]
MKKPFEYYAAIAQRLVESGQEFALYRFPCETAPRLIVGNAVPLQDTHYSVSAASSVSGFLFHPFSPTRTCPTLLIRPEIACRGWDIIDSETENLPHQRITLCHLEHKLQRPVPRSDDFQRIYRIFRNQIDRGRFHSLYLSQAIEGRWAEDADEGTLFMKMAEMYPEELVYLTYTRIGGRWTGHTPRMLLRGGSSRWETVSPSGTRHITFSPDGAHLINDVLQIPPEEVSGQPSSSAREFIRLHEGYPRLYFTGTVGPLNLYGETVLFLNLSCLKQHPASQAIFYGGTMLKR